MKTSSSFPDGDVAAAVQVYQGYVKKRLPVVLFRLLLLSLSAETLRGCRRRGAALRMFFQAVSDASSDKTRRPRSPLLMELWQLLNRCSWWAAHQAPRQPTQKCSPTSESSAGMSQWSATGQLSGIMWHLPAAEAIPCIHFWCLPSMEWGVVPQGSGTARQEYNLNISDIRRKLTLFSYLWTFFQTYFLRPAINK